MRLLAWIRAHWRTQNETDELLRLVVKAGRRCAYDLSHCAGGNREPEEAQIFHERAQYWLTLFNPADDGKNYRDRLHTEIYNLEREAKRLRKLLIQNNIPHDDPESIPF